MTDLPYSTLDHTADTGLEASADSLPKLIEELATGMFGLMADVEPCPADQMVEASIEVMSTEDLIVDALSELLLLSDTEGLHLCRFEVVLTDADVAHISAAGISTEKVELTGPPIKAVTYHQLRVTRTETGWSATVYFDV